MPPAHAWEKQHYRHVADLPTFNVHVFDAFGTFAGNMVRAISNMGNAYRTALADIASPSSRDHEPDEPIRMPAATIDGLMDVGAGGVGAGVYHQCFVAGAKWAAKTITKGNR
jgi:hypothetical protein